MVTAQNAEQGRALSEMLGWARVLRALDATVIDAHPDPEIGTLLECEVRGEITRFLRVRCGTGREFARAVPPDIASAQSAQDWMWGLAADEYAPEVRT